MNEADIRQLIARVRSGDCSEEECLLKLKGLQTEELGFARIDHHRQLRTGYPEVIFGQGKTAGQVAEIFLRLTSRSPLVMATRVSSEQVAAVRTVVPDCQHHELARLLCWNREPRFLRFQGEPFISVVSAGTADLPVAEEAAVTLETIGWPVERIYDVGVAGLHRLLSQSERLQRARIIIVAAGMEGALASVVGGLVNAPVIAVPTSVGYGASFHGLSALLTMLNSCATGVTVVNIDNGFGAGSYAAILAEMVCSFPPTGTAKT